VEGQAEAGLGRYNPQVGAVVIEVWKTSGYDSSLSIFGEDQLSYFIDNEKKRIRMRPLSKTQ